MDSSPLRVLPPEVLDRIVGKLDPNSPHSRHSHHSQDLKYLRLTCQTLNEIAARWLYRKLWIWVSMESDRIDYGEGKLQPIVEKYAHLIREIDFDGTENDAQYDWSDPYDVVPYLEQMPFLQRLRVYGMPRLLNKWTEERPEFRDLIFKAGLQTPLRDRILPNLRYMDLDLVEYVGHPKCLSTIGDIFLIPQLEELRIKDAILKPMDGRLPVDVPEVTAVGSTALKTLCITASHIDIRAIANILSLPKALAHLSLNHHSLYPIPFGQARFPEGFEQDTRTKEDLCQAILQQQKSLETLKVTGWDGAPSDEKYSFPQLRENEGNFEKWFTGSK